MSKLKAVNQQIEARWTRTASAALTNGWKQKQAMRNYQSEYDRIRHEISNSALPFQTKEGVTNRKAEFEQMGVKLQNSIS